MSPFNMSKVKLFIAWCSDTWNIIINIKNYEGMVARRFHDHVVDERMLEHHLKVVHVFYGLRNPDIIKVEDRSTVASVIYGVEVNGGIFMEYNVEHVLVFIEQCVIENPVVITRNNCSVEAS
jgi:hypothetical protein